MPFFVSRRELARLERELKQSRQDASTARNDLAEERRRRDEIVLAVLDTKATKDGGYPVSSRLPHKALEEEPETPAEYHERLKEQHSEVWGYYLQVATQNGKSEDDAMDWLVCHAEGRPLPFEQGVN